MAKRMTKYTKAALTALADLGVCYKSDLLLYIDYLAGRRNEGSYLIKSLEQNNLLDDYITDQPSRRKGVYHSCKLSHDGKWYAIRHCLTNTEEETRQRIEESQKEFVTKDVSTTNRQLMKNRITLACSAVGIKALPSEKPSLPALYGEIYGKPLDSANYGKTAASARSENLYKKMNEKEIRRAMSTGIFYNMAEVRELLNLFAESNADRIAETIAYGLLITTEQVSVLYASVRGNNKDLFTVPSIENRFLSSISVIIDMTNTNRVLPSMRSKTMNVLGQITEDSAPINGVQAIVLSDGNHLVYRMTSHTAKHHVYAPKSILNTYERVYIVPFTAVGLDALAYLSTHTIEQWQGEMLDYCNEDRNMIIQSGNAYFPGKDHSTNALVTYMPVYELRALSVMRNSDAPYGVITYEDMRETINRAVAKEIVFYEIDTHQRAATANGESFDKTGRYEGISELLSYAEKCGYTVKPSEINALAKEMGLSTKELSQKIHTRELAMPDITSQLTHYPLKPKRIQRRSKTVYTELKPSEKRQLIKAAKYHNLSMSSYIRNAILPEIEADAARYDQWQKAARPLQENHVRPITTAKKGEN